MVMNPFQNFEVPNSKFYAYTGWLKNHRLYYDYHFFFAFCLVQFRNRDFFFLSPHFANSIDRVLIRNLLLWRSHVHALSYIHDKQRLRAHLTAAIALKLGPDK